MPAAIVWLLGGLATLLQGLVPRILFALGIGFVTYAGVDVALASLRDAAIARFSGLPGVVIDVLSLTRVDEGLTLIFSSYMAVLALRTTQGVLTRVTMKGTV